MKRGLTGMTLLALSFMLSGCDEPIDPQQFNNTVALSQRQIARSAKEFRMAVSPLLALKPQNPTDATVTDSYKKLRDTLAKVEKTIQEAQPPPTAKGEQFKQAYLNYLHKQKKLLEDNFVRIVAIALNPVQEPSSKREALQAIYKQIDQTDREAVEELQKVQKEFADENKLKLLRDPK